MDWSDVRLNARSVRSAAQSGDDMMATSTSVILKRAMRAHGLMLKRIGDDDVYVGRVLGILHRRAKLVSVARGLTPEERRVVVAHELGHFHMHDDPRLALSRSNFSFDGRIGEGYSEGELKEVQADVFAAEFLCPSDWLAEELDRGRRRPADIARQLGVPCGLVFAQAGVALLDGAKRSSRPAPKGVPPLRADQAEAAAWSGGHLLVDGAPSSGKTVTAAARVVHLLRSNVPPASIAVLAHSDSLAARLLEMVSTSCPGATVQVWSGTMQAFAKEIVGTHPKRIGRTSDFRTLDDVAALSLLAATGLVPTGDGLEARRARSAVMRQVASDKNRLRSPQTADAAAIRQAYDTLLRREDAVDAADLVPFAIDMLQRDRKLLTRLQARYNEVVIDDFEEATPAGIALLRLLAGPGTRIFAAGGGSQSIFRFRDASPKAVSDFEIAFAGRRLTLSDRRAVLPHRPRTSEGPCATIGSSGSTIEITVAADATCECDRIAGKIREWEASGMKLSDQVVLARRHDVLTRVAKGLEKRGVPVSHAGDHIRRPEILDLLAVSAMATSKDGTALWRLSKLYGASPDALRSLRRFRKRSAGIGDLEALRRLDEVETLSQRDRAILVRLGSDFLGVPPDGRTLDAVHLWLFEHSNYLLPSSRRRRHDATACRSIRTFLDICADHDAQRGSSLADLKARLRRVRSLSQDSRYRRARNEAPDADGVRFMTVHAAKGLHFKGVHLVGTTEPPAHGTGRRDEAVDEQETAVSLTATTRAVERLHVSWVRSEVGPDPECGRPDAAPVKQGERLVAPGLRRRGRRSRQTPAEAADGERAPGSFRR